MLPDQSDSRPDLKSMTDGMLSTLFDRLIDEFVERGYDCRASDNPVGAFADNRERFVRRRDTSR